MRMHWVIGLVAAAAVLAGSAVAGEAQAPQAPETRRIGVVFIQQVFKNYNYARDMEQKMKDTFTPDQQRIEAEIQRVQELEKALQNNPLKPTGGAPWRKSMMEIEAAKVEIQTMQEDFGKRVSEEEAALWLNMYNAFQRACKTIGDYYQYDIIVATPNIELSDEVIRAQNPAAFQSEIMMRRIQYVRDSANLTKVITDLLNHRYQQYQQNPQANSL